MKIHRFIFLAINLCLISIHAKVSQWKVPEGYESISQLGTKRSIGTTYYVREDGGTRYSEGNTNGQCNGMADAAYPGSGVNQACAFNDVRYLWSKGPGTSCYDGGDQSTCFKWIGTNPGDTYIVYPKASGWRVGYDGPNIGDSNGFAVAGDPYNSGAPNFSSGTPDAPIRFLGSNYLNCTSDSVKTKIFGGYRADAIFRVMSGSNLEFGCLDLTDNSACGVAAKTCGKECFRDFPLEDSAWYAFKSNKTLQNATFFDLNMHGLASSAWFGPTGNNVKILRAKMNGNSAAGMNMDLGDGTTGSGNLYISYFELIGNGCLELFPLDNKYDYPYTCCMDQSAGGYGDAFGTATATSNPTWLIHFDHGELAYNTQDGIDGLHVVGVDSKGTHSQLLMRNILSHGNMGDQIKCGSSSELRNSIVYDNAAAMHGSIPGFPTGYNTYLTNFGRGGGGLVVIVSPGKDVIIEGITMASSNTVGVLVVGDPSCTDSTCALIYRNNVNFGYVCGSATGWPGCSGEVSNRMYTDTAPDHAVFTFKGTKFEYNAVLGDKSACPNTAKKETNAICGTPGLVDETYHFYGLGDFSVASNLSAIYKAGIYSDTMTTDFYDFPRLNPPTMGALELGSYQVEGGWGSTTGSGSTSDTTTTAATTTKSSTTGDVVNSAHFVGPVAVISAICFTMLFL